MSNAVLPTGLLGLKWDVKRRPRFSTLIQRSASLRENRIALASYPLWEFELAYAVLRSALKAGQGGDPDFQTLVDFWIARNGPKDSFLWEDTYTPDNSVTDFQFGTGDGATTQFQLARAFKAGGFLEPVMNVKVLTNIKKATVVQTNPANYTIDANGLVTFVGAPAAAAALTWTGTYYHRCRFGDDVTEFNEFMYRMFELQSLPFIGSPMNKV